MKFQFHIRDMLVVTGYLAAALSFLCSIDSYYLVGILAGLFAGGVIAFLLALLLATPLYFMRRGVRALWDWFDEGRRDDS